MVPDILTVAGGHFFFPEHDHITGLFDRHVHHVEAVQKGAAILDRQIPAKGAQGRGGVVVIGPRIQDVVCGCANLGLEIGNLIVLTNGAGGKLGEFRKAPEEGSEVEPETKSRAVGCTMSGEPFPVRAVTTNEKSQVLQDGGMPSDRAVGDPVSPESKRCIGCEDGVVLPFRRKARQHRVEGRNDGRFQAHQGCSLAQRVDYDVTFGA